MQVIDGRLALRSPLPVSNAAIASLASTPRSATPVHLSWFDQPAGSSRLIHSPSPRGAVTPLASAAVSASSGPCTSSFDTLVDGSGRAEVEQSSLQQAPAGDAACDTRERLIGVGADRSQHAPEPAHAHLDRLSQAYQQLVMQAQQPGTNGGSLYGAPSPNAVAAASAIAAQPFLQGQYSQTSGGQGLFAPGYSVAMHQHTLNPAVNIGNTRPMTAPSSAAAPFYLGAYSGPSSFYTSQPDSGAPFAYQPSFQYAVDSQDPSPVGPNPLYSTSHLDMASHQHPHAMSHQQAYEGARERGFSLPDIPGLPPHAVVDNGLGDDLRYSSGGSDGQPSPISSNNPFLYAPPQAPTQARALTFPSSTFSATGMAPTLADPRDLLPASSQSRPTTAESSRPTSSHTRAQTQPLLLRSPYTTVGKPVESSAGPAKTYNFVASAGQQKRPRRRYDEIERLYACNYPGCTKAYGTLNHLNSHKTMQKHGPRSTPAEFKEMRKKWRENKKREAAEAARQAAAEGRPVDTKSLKAKSSERPRPSTSAGEYHYNVPAPLVTTHGSMSMFPTQMPLPPAPGAAYVDPTVTSAGASLYPHAMALQPHPMFISGGQAGMFANPSTAMLDASSSPSRPVTAPNHYGAPAFGYASSFAPSSSQARFSTNVNGASGAMPLPRRMSLPGISELKAPQPILGYNGGSLSDVAEAGAGGLIEEDEHTLVDLNDASANGATTDFGGGIGHVEETGQLQKV
ncbi:hypothetical protein OIV83_004022 [Microbotryomycetes sp. JL201]|nr:hypothetical protein OIV83_004022 [Microbotryomycetes sp. JL201]